jgi:hypothetical protein
MGPADDGCLGLGALGAQLGTRLPLPMWEHKILLVWGPVCCALAGVFLGVWLVMGVPARGEFGVLVYATAGFFALVGFAVPAFVLYRFVAVVCPCCGGRAYLGTDSTVSRKLFASYYYKCTQCHHTMTRLVPPHQQ